MKNVSKITIYDSRRRGLPFESSAAALGRYGQPSLSIGLFEEGPLGGPIQLPLNLPKKRLLEEATAIAELLDKPMELAHWLRVVEVAAENNGAFQTASST